MPISLTPQRCISGSLPSILAHVILPLMDEYSKIWGPACLAFGGGFIITAAGFYATDKGGHHLWRLVVPPLAIGIFFMLLAGVGAYRGFLWAKKKDAKQTEKDAEDKWNKDHPVL